jgi:hypothetical protein
MAKLDKTTPVNLQELIVSSLAMTDALAKLLIEKGLITREESMQKISEERGDVSKTIQSHTAMTIGEILIWEATNGLLLIAVVGSLLDLIDELFGTGGLLQHL